MLPINITAYSPWGQNPPTFGNILDTDGLVDQLIIDIDAHGGNNQQKLTTYLKCLSQALHVRGRLQGECESKLHAKIVHVAKDHRADVKVVAADEAFKHDTLLQPTIKKVQYIASSYFKRYLHHLKNAVGNTKQSGVIYLGLGLGFVIGGPGLQAILAEDSINGIYDNKTVAWIALSIGVLMMVYPILNPLRLALHDEP